MAIRQYLAMTGAEIENSDTLPPKIGWMACHFSPYGTGVSHLPRNLPPDSLLIFDDINPVHGHDPQTIAGQLARCVERLECGAVLLDFQRPGYAEAADVARVLVQSLPCPVGVAEPYARDLDCPVFPPPAPLNVPVEDWLAPWQGREIWLELALDAQTICLTAQGASVSALAHAPQNTDGFREARLCCRYRLELSDSRALFTLWRTREDLDALLDRSEALGVTRAVGLYQELGREKPALP